MGRLVEMWATRIATPRDVKALAGQFTDAAVKPPGKSIVCADYRKLGVFSTETVDAWVETFRVLNVVIERSALLIPASPTSALQFNRIVSGAPHVSRRVFTHPTEMKAWLASSLELRERERLERFLDENEHS